MEHTLGRWLVGCVNCPRCANAVTLALVVATVAVAVALALFWVR